MKNILKAMAFLALFGSQNVYSLETVKVMDGSSAHCKTKADFYRGKLGAYRLNATGIREVSGKIELDLSLTFLRCSEKAKGYGFKLESPYKTQVSTDELNEVTTMTISNVLLRAYQDGIYELVSNDSIRNEKAYQKVTVRIPLEKLEVQEGITSIDFFLLKDIEIKVDGEILTNGLEPFGKFRVRFSKIKGQYNLL